METKVNWVANYPDCFSHSLKSAIDRYVLQGIKPGSFLCAVINNDLAASSMLADSSNKKILTDIALWFHEYAPVECTMRGWRGLENK